MNSLSRRSTLITLASIATAATLTPLLGHTADGTGTDSQQGELGSGADFEALETQIQVLFGDSRGRYLREYLINSDDPRTSVESERVYDQFAAVYSAGPAEYDAELSNGMRMVVRCVPHNSMYKAIVVLQPDGFNIASAALTFYYSPPGGVQEVVAGVPTVFDCEQRLSVVVFYQTESLDPAILDSLKDFFRHYPMPRERILAPILAQRKVRVRAYGRRLLS